MQHVAANLAGKSTQSGEVVATAREAADMLCDWRNPTRPGEKSPENSLKDENGFFMYVQYTYHIATSEVAGVR